MLPARLAAAAARATTTPASPALTHGPSESAVAPGLTAAVAPAVAAVLALLAGCGAGAERAGASTAVGAAAGPRDPRIAAVEQGLLPAVRVRGEDVRYPLAQRMRELGVPGVSVAVFEHGELVWAKGYGVADVDTGAPVTETTLFQAASISKPVNATAVLLAVERGALALDAPINDALKSWKLPENELTRATPVTLRRLLSHTAGTTVHGFAGYEAGEPLPTLEAILSGAPPANSPAVIVDLAPGTDVRYSGGGTTLSQLALVDQLRRPYAAILADTVLGPVGMAHSTYEQPLPAARLAEAATGHVRGKAIVGKRHVYPEQAAAGLWTTPSDLARFFAELQRARAGRSKVIPQAVARAMTTPVLAKVREAGLGVWMFERNGAALFGHSGGNFGFECDAVASLDGEHGVVIMANGEGARRLFQELEAAVFAAHRWPGAPPEIERARVADAELARAAGRYAIELGRPIEVAAERGALFVRSPLRAPVELIAQADGSYLARDDGATYRFAGTSLERRDPGGAQTWSRVPDGTRVPLLELAAGRDDEALAAGRAILAATPGSPAVDDAALNGYGYAVLSEGNAAGAVRILRLASALHPTSANTLDSLGDAYDAAGDPVRAIGSYEASLAAAPTDPALPPAARGALTRETGKKLARLRAAR